MVTCHGLAQRPKLLYQVIVVAHLVDDQAVMIYRGVVKQRCGVVLVVSITGLLVEGADMLLKAKVVEA